MPRVQFTLEWVAEDDSVEGLGMEEVERVGVEQAL